MRNISSCVSCLQVSELEGDYEDDSDSRQKQP